VVYGLQEAPAGVSEDAALLLQCVSSYLVGFTVGLSMQVLRIGVCACAGFHNCGAVSQH
jgi:hypothetical protein